MMDITKLPILDLFLYQEMIESLIEEVNEDEADHLESKLERIQQEILNRIDTI